MTNEAFARVKKRYGVWLLLLQPHLLPLVKRLDRNKATPPLKRLAEYRLAVHRLGHRVDGREADLDVLAQ